VWKREERYHEDSIFTNLYSYVLVYHIGSHSSLCIGQSTRTMYPSRHILGKHEPQRAHLLLSWYTLPSFSFLFINVFLFTPLGLTEKATNYYRLFINWTNQKIKKTFVNRQAQHRLPSSPYPKYIYIFILGICSISSTFHPMNAEWQTTLVPWCCLLHRGCCTLVHHLRYSRNGQEMKRIWLSSLGECLCVSFQKITNKYIFIYV